MNLRQFSDGPARKVLKEKIAGGTQQKRQSPWALPSPRFQYGLTPKFLSGG
jgi:hypothetical protein